MLIAYLTTDEVNLDFAAQLADEQSLIYPINFWEMPPDEQFDGIVYDLDHLPPTRRREVLVTLLSGPQTLPSVVHSYQLDETRSRLLRQNGVTTYRRLERAIFTELAQAGGRHRRLPIRRGTKELAFDIMPLFKARRATG